MPDLFAGVMGQWIGVETEIAVEERMGTEDDFRIEREQKNRDEEQQPTGCE